MATAVKKQPRAGATGGGTFRVLHGGHWDKGPPGCECVQCEKSAKDMADTIARDGPQKTGPTAGFDPATGRDAKRRAPQHKYHQRSANSPADYDNDVVESDTDLCARFNDPAKWTHKFERIGADGRGYEQATQLPQPKPLKDMTKRMLLSIIADEEIDLKGLDPDKATREQLVKAIESAE